MENNELNEKIAILRGWVLHPHEKLGSMYDPTVKWYNPKTNQTLWTHDPDYCGDWKLAGELLDDMADNGYCPALIFDDDGHWSVSTDGNQTINFESPCDVHTSFFVKKEDWRDTPTRAIAEAWYDMCKDQTE